MSYDVEVATHTRPDGLEAPDGVTVDGPVAAEPDDLAEALAAAVLAPRWLTTLSVPYDASQRRRDALRSLARRLAQEHEGAAYDPQEDAVFFPRGRPKRVPAGKAEKTSIVRLAWYLDAERWAQAPGVLLHAIERRCPEALPTRYGVYEPPQGRYDPTAPDAFTALARDDSSFWFASRPFFGGDSSPPERGTGKLAVQVDWRVLDTDPRWRETVVDLFAGAASALGAFYAEAWVEPGWEVSRNNRLWITAGRKTRGSALGRDGWEGLPAEPAWLTWFGGRYCEPVAAALAEATPRRRRLLGRPAPPPSVDARPEGLLVRLGEQPRAKLPALPLPPELVRPRG
ncbi:MAG TPA: hypothetical protein VEX67_04815 [Solirubrobacteraceae bacterium]|nr:hypothetical protein [Solirubrobacteraceae bacterium]